MKLSSILDFSIPKSISSCVFRQFGLFNFFSSTSPAAAAASAASEVAHKPITQRHGLLKRLMRRATSRDRCGSSCLGSTADSACVFSTNANPVQGLRLSTNNLVGMDQQRPNRQKLFRRRSSAPVTPKTLGRRRTYLSTEGLSRFLSRDSFIRRDFEAFAAEQYALENVSFMESLLEWQKVHNYGFAEALRLCETYIFDGSCLQINISYDSRTGIESIIAECEDEGTPVPHDLFDKAASEISTMMQGGLWGTFVSRGGCDRAESLAETIERRSQSREYAGRARSTTNGGLLELV
jgi:hypothetical protein